MCKLHYMQLRYVQTSLCANFSMCKLYYMQLCATSLCANFIIYNFLMCKLHCRFATSALAPRHEQVHLGHSPGPPGEQKVNTCNIIDIVDKIL